VVYQRLPASSDAVHNELPTHVMCVFAWHSPSAVQMLAIAFFIFLLALVGMFYPYNRGALLSACVVLYALTAGIAGAWWRQHADPCHAPV